MTALWLFSTMRGMGFVPNPRFDIALRKNPFMNDEELGELYQAKPFAIQNALRESLDAMVKGTPVDIKLHGSVTTRINDDGAVDLNMHLVDPGGDDRLVASILAQLMFFSGVKAVKKCERCGGFTLVRKSMTKKFCSDNCRQRAHHAGMGWKQKQLQGQKRSEAYRNKKAGK